MRRINIARARKILKRLPKAKRAPLPFDYSRENIIDALSDLRHACDLKKLDFGELDKIAYGYYATAKYAPTGDVKW